MSDAERFDLRQAIAREQLALHFQPRVVAGGMRMIGAEALLRHSTDGKNWHGVDGLASLSADEFGLLWQWKMGQLARCFAALRNCGWNPAPGAPGFFVSLNLSHEQLGSEAWAQQLLDALGANRIPGSCIEVELTEQGTVTDVMLASSAFERVRAAGVVLALDDFPEGGASFLRLAQFKFDKVKLDRCMLPVLEDPVSVWMKKRTILKDLLGVIERNGAVPVLEGVEREAQYRFLSGLGITEWQGYLWGKAVPLHELLERPEFAQQSQPDVRTRTALAAP